MLSFELRIGKVKTGLITGRFTIISPKLVISRIYSKFIMNMMLHRISRLNAPASVDY